jgi:sn-glycerol 3-phosphate transport system ATP-binding protein
MSVFKNMAYGLRIRRMPRDEIERRVRRAADILELTDFLERKPRQLSGGQRQRVAMGRCIVREPKVFLFDEPLSNLDAKLRVQMRLELRNLHETLKVTSIYVTHDQVEAMTLADRLVVMRDGYAEQIGSPLEVYERPATTFVAGFIGSPAMNFITVRVAGDGRAVVLPTGETLTLAQAAPASHASREAILGLRPEHLTLCGEGDGGIRLQATHVETLGADTLVYGHLADRQSALTMRLADIRRFRRGHLLFFKVAPEKLHLFDRQSGGRL